MEDFPGSLPEAKANKNQDKEKKHKKGANLRLPPLAALENAPKEKAAKPEAPTLTEQLINKREPAQKVEKIAEKTKPVAEKFEPEAPQKPTEATELRQSKSPIAVEERVNAAESDKDEEDSSYEPLPGYEPELKPNEEVISGEFIRLLDGEEHVLLLHADDSEAEPPQELPPETPVSTQPLERQPEYSRPAEERPESPEPTGAGGGEVPPVEPPEAPPASPEQPPEPPRPVAEAWPRPEDLYVHQAQTSPNVTPHVANGEQLATKKELDDAVYYAAKAGQNRGLLTGLLVGGAYEHFKHKRREKRQAKRFKQQTKQLEHTREDQHFFYEQQTKTQAGYERQLAAAEKRFEKPVQIEKLPQGALSHPEVTAAEQLEIPADHRLETSAWHSIEVDAKTGKPVENPAFQYGHEYYRERAQENTPAVQRNVATGEVALVAAAGTNPDPSSAGGSNNTIVPPAQIPDATTQGSPEAVKTQPKDTPTDQSASSNAPLWPWLLALVVVAICLIAVLH